LPVKAWQTRRIGIGCDMDGTKTTLERAFELAKSGQVRSIESLRAKLKVEGYMLTQLTGGSLIRQLRDLIKQSDKGI
jgi:hypothetical protein